MIPGCMSQCEVTQPILRLFNFLAYRRGCNSLSPCAEMERREPLLLVLDVDVGAVLDEQLHDVHVVVARRVVQRGDPGRQFNRKKI